MTKGYFDYTNEVPEQIFSLFKNVLKNISHILKLHSIHSSLKSFDTKSLRVIKQELLHVEQYDFDQHETFCLGNIWTWPQLVGGS